MSGSIDSISAVTLAVADMARSVAFYEAIGLRVVFGGRDASFTTVRAGEAFVNLRRATDQPGGRWGRVIFRVRGVDELHRAITGRGIAAPAPRDAEWGERYFEIPDPDGIIVSFAQLL
jgi:catechol 2,3-dioxygenase-like lactoylglutathione lyase family enzyme